jgi:hypothetical protein
MGARPFFPQSSFMGSLERWRGQARLVVKEAYAACPLRQLRDCALPYLPHEQHVDFTASAGVIIVTGCSRHFLDGHVFGGDEQMFGAK